MRPSPCRSSCKAVPGARDEKLRTHCVRRMAPPPSRLPPTARCSEARTCGRVIRGSGFPSLAFGSGLVQGHGGANESLQCLLVYLLALVKVDGAPCVPLKTGVEKARRILQRRSFGEGHLHHALVSLAGADQSVVRPHRNPSPLPLLH